MFGSKPIILKLNSDNDTKTSSIGTKRNYISSENITNDNNSNINDGNDDYDVSDYLEFNTNRTYSDINTLYKNLCPNQKNLRNM